MKSWPRRRPLRAWECLRFGFGIYFLLSFLRILSGSRRTSVSLTWQPQAPSRRILPHTAHKPSQLGRTQRPGRKRQVQLFENHLPDIDLPALVKEPVDVLIVEFLLQFLHFLGQKDQIEAWSRPETRRA